jgi:hypothetical protein
MKSGKFIQIDDTKLQKYLVTAGIFFLLLITFLSIAMRIYMLVFPRSLWWDEAALVDNIVTRNFKALAASPLNNSQTVPVLYLYTVKTLGAIFGYTEASLRLYSFFAFLGVLSMLYIILAKYIKIKKIFIFTGICLAATFDIYMRYSNEVKPYMGEVFFILAVLVLFNSYQQRQINIVFLTFFNISVLLFSNSVLFFIAGVYIFCFFDSLFAKDRKETIRIFLAGSCVILLFTAYYLWWLAPVAKSGVMANSWRNSAFRLFPFSLAYFKRNINLILDLVDKRQYIFLIFSAIGFFLSILSMNKTTIIVGISLSLFLIASNFGMAPIVDRLCLFVYVFIVIYTVVCVNAIDFSVNQNISIMAVLILCCFLVLANYNFVSYRNDFVWSNETNPLIEYVQVRIKDNEYLFSDVRSNFVIKYKTKYSDRIGNVENENIIYGQNRYDWNGENIDRYKATEEQLYPWNILWDYGRDANYPNEIEEVVRHKKVYLIFSHLNSPSPQEMIGYGLGKLREAGKLTEILNVHDTYLYYFEAFEI